MTVAQNGSFSEVPQAKILDDISRIYAMISVEM
jgi:hypothetical protein